MSAQMVSGKDKSPPKPGNQNSFRLKGSLRGLQVSPVSQYNSIAHSMVVLWPWWVWNNNNSYSYYICQSFRNVSHKLNKGTAPVIIYSFIAKFEKSLCFGFLWTENHEATLTTLQVHHVSTARCRNMMLPFQSSECAYITRLLRFKIVKLLFKDVLPAASFYWTLAGGFMGDTEASTCVFVISSSSHPLYLNHSSTATQA